MNLSSVLPNDSILHYWLTSRSIIEPPESYDLLTALSALGAMLKRNCWIDQVAFKVFPNMSTLLIGPSGIGKDTAIDGAEEILQEFDTVPIVGGMTSERICDAMMGYDPAAAVIFAPEFSEFFGSKDYQKDLFKVLTDLLTTKAYKDISLKSTGQRRIIRPTLTVIGGSTQQWLHEEMPKSAMSGGFYPRFIIAVEEKPKRSVAWVKLTIPNEERLAAALARETFMQEMGRLLAVSSDIGEVVPDGEAKDMYEDWYEVRQEDFSPIAAAYAHRCRDHVFRLAMLCAVSRGHTRLEGADIYFGLSVIKHIAHKIDGALAPPHIEAMIAGVILSMLPARREAIYRGLSHYRRRDIGEAMSFLLESKQIKMTGSGDHGMYEASR